MKNNAILCGAWLFRGTGVAVISRRNVVRAVPAGSAPLDCSRQVPPCVDDGSLSILLSWRVVAGASYYDRVAFEMDKRPAECLELRSVEAIRRSQRDEHDLVLTVVHDVIELGEQ